MNWKSRAGRLGSTSLCLPRKQSNMHAKQHDMQSN